MNAFDYDSEFLLRPNVPAHRLLAPGDLCKSRYGNALTVFPVYNPGSLEIRAPVGWSGILRATDICMVVGSYSSLAYLIAPTVVGWRWLGDLEILAPVGSET